MTALDLRLQEFETGKSIFPCLAEVCPAAETPGKQASLLSHLGPGLITGAADDDPSGIGTYSIAGATLGYSTLWTALITYPLLVNVQLTCARIGLVTGKGLTSVVRQHYPRLLLYPIIFGLLIANTFNAGADIAAISAALALLIPLPAKVLTVTVAMVIIALQIFGSYKTIASALKWLSLSLFAYIATAFFARIDWWAVARGTLMPTVHWNGTFFSILLAILGTTISPYLFFWQTDQEVEEKILSGRRLPWQRPGMTAHELAGRTLDVKVGMLFSNLVMYFIILATAATLFASGHHQIGSAADAAAALRPVAGNAATILFALGIVGGGVLAVPILTTSSAYAISQAFDWNHGLGVKFHKAPGFYGVIAASTFVGILIDWLGFNPIKALFWCALINGFLAPPLLLVILLIANNKTIMGRHVNSKVENMIGAAATLLMSASAIATILTFNRT